MDELNETLQPTQISESLKQHHERIKEALPTVLDDTGDARRSAFARVRRMLAAHEALEQEVVHPQAKRDVDDDAVDARIEEEEEAGDAIAKLEGMDVDSPEFEESYSRFMLDVIAHAEHEEHQEFDMINTELSGSDAERFRTGMRLVEDADQTTGAQSRGQESFEELLENAKKWIDG